MDLRGAREDVIVACEKIHVCSYIAKPPVNTRDSELTGVAMKMFHLIVNIQNSAAGFRCENTWFDSMNSRI